MRFLAALLSCVLASTPLLAREITPAEKREQALDALDPFDILDGVKPDAYSAKLPACEDGNVLSDIANTFALKEYRFWSSNVRILAFENVRQTAWRPWGLDYIPRRFCTGTAVMSDGYKRKVHFSIREDLGFIGVRWGTEACVDGFDRHYAFAPQCRQAAP